MLNIAIVELGINIVTFLIALFILWKIFYKPLMKALETRRRKIEQTIEAAENNKSEMEKLKSEYETKILEVQKKVDELIKEAVKNGQRTKDEIIAEARDEAKKVLSNTQSKLLDEKEKMLKELKEEVVRLAILSAEKIIQTTMNKEIQTKVVNDFLNKLEKTGKSNN